MVPFTESTSANTPVAELKNACWVAVKLPTELPAPAVPPRGPGSVWADAKPANKMAGKTKVEGISIRRVIRVPPKIQINMPMLAQVFRLMVLLPLIRATGDRTPGRAWQMPGGKKCGFEFPERPLLRCSYSKRSGRKIQ